MSKSRAIMFHFIRIFFVLPVIKLLKFNIVFIEIMCVKKILKNPVLLYSALRIMLNESTLFILWQPLPRIFFNRHKMIKTVTK